MPEPTALFALPGLGLGAEAWQPTLEHLGDRPAYVHLSPGYGRPASGREELDPRRLAEGALAALPPGAGDVVVLGHSAGCQIAAHLTTLAPDRVRALVLIGPSTDPRAATWPRLVRRWVATAVHEPPRQFPVLARQYLRTTFRTMLHGMDVVRRDAILTTLGDVHVPVLVVRGAHDHIAPADWVAEVSRRGGAGSRHVTLSKGAHMVPLTHGPLVAEVVAPFLAELD
ncbi:alpha/beta hydrolase [Knoellia locipacati]|uniref:alpha/beta fold hydrolase n=1 Tax=Knoellia locipacati TaxID=882824 RepID=UPI00384AD906